MYRLWLLQSGLVLSLVFASVPVSEWRPPTDRFTQLVKEEKNKEENTHSLKGTLQSVDGCTIKVVADAQKTVTLGLNSGTAITVEGKKATLSELKKGQDVRCTYAVREGANVCLALTATAAESKN